MKKTISAILLVATLLTTVIASCFVAGEKALVANAASESYYTLEVSAPETANAGDVIDVVMTAKNIKTELDAIEFFLDFDETKLAGVITESGESMDKFMTVVPQYIMEYNGVEIGPAPRYEQICRYNTETGVYECRFLDLMQYPMAKAGQEYKGLINDGDIVITIQFKVLDTVANGDELVFAMNVVKGTTRGTLNGVVGSANTAKTVIGTADSSVEEPSIEESSIEEPSIEESSMDEPSVEDNYALNKGYEVQSDLGYLSGKEDNGVILTDGIIPEKETAGQTAAFAGTGAVNTIIVNLGKVYTDINEILVAGVVVNSNRKYADVVIEVSENGTDYSAVANVALTETEIATTIFNMSHTFDDVSAQYVKLTFTSKDYVLTIGDVQVYGSGKVEEPSEPETSSPASSEAPESSEAPVVPENVQFNLDIEAPTNVQAGDIIDVVISIKDIKTQLDAIEFFLDFDETKLAGVITEVGDAMNAFMTVVPQYTMEYNGAVVGLAPRYEQICRYDAENGIYECRFVDLLQYTMAKPGEEYKGLINDGDLVVTIQFKVLDTVAEGDELVFNTVDGSVKGTTRGTLISVKGYADTATTAIVKADTSIEEPSVAPSVDPEPSVAPESSADESSEEIPEDAQFTLDVKVPANAQAGDVIDVVITIKDIKTQLDAAEFFLDFDETKLAGVITETGDAMNAFMTVVPQYTMEYNGVEVGPAPRYEQICRYDAENGVYECRFIDLLQYAMAKPGEEYKGLINDGDLVVTIQFTVLDTVAEGDELVFAMVDGSVKGTTRGTLFGVKGYANTAKTVIGSSAPVTSEPETSDPIVSEPESSEPEIKEGLCFDEDGEIRYYVDGQPTYAGVVQDADGNYYYINSSKKAVKNCSYTVSSSRTNGLIKAGKYEFDADGKMIIPEGFGDGLKVDEDGEIRYYVDGQPTYAGVVKDDDGNYYYINSAKKAVKNQTYYISEAKANGLIEAGTYIIDENGRFAGLIKEVNGDIIYVENGQRIYAGLVQDADGNFYYINSSKKAVKNCSYTINASKTNGLLEAGTYTFGEDGKMVLDGREGLYFDKDGEIRYYVNGQATYAGVVQDADGNFYYINSTKKAVKNITYYISESKTNGLIEAGTYTIDADGKIIID